MFEKLKYFGVLLLALWVLLAFTAWHYESTCGVFFMQECWSQHWAFVRKLVLLKWVYGYQTLLAGLAALAGGAAVVWAARMQIVALRNAEIARDRKRFESCLLVMAVEFGTVSREIKREKYDSVAINRSEIRRLSHGLTEFTPHFASFARKLEVICFHELDLAIEITRNPDESPSARLKNKQKVRFFSELASASFSFLYKEVNENKTSLEDLKIPLDRFKKAFTKFGFTKADFKEIIPYFDWTTIE